MKAQPLAQWESPNVCVFTSSLNFKTRKSTNFWISHNSARHAWKVSYRVPSHYEVWEKQGARRKTNKQTSDKLNRALIMMFGALRTFVNGTLNPDRNHSTLRNTRRCYFLTRKFIAYFRDSDRMRFRSYAVKLLPDISWAFRGLVSASSLKVILGDSASLRCVGKVWRWQIQTHRLFLPPTLDSVSFIPVAKVGAPKHHGGHSQAEKVHSPKHLKRRRISDVVRSGSIIIFHLS